MHYGNGDMGNFIDVLPRDGRIFNVSGIIEKPLRAQNWYYRGTFASESKN